MQWYRYTIFGVQDICSCQWMHVISVHRIVCSTYDIINITNIYTSYRQWLHFNPINPMHFQNAYKNLFYAKFHVHICKMFDILMHFSFATPFGYESKEIPNFTLFSSIQMYETNRMESNRIEFWLKQIGCSPTNWFISIFIIQWGFSALLTQSTHQSS